MTKTKGNISRKQVNSSRCRLAGRPARSTGPQYQKLGRPARLTDVNKLELGRRPGRPTEVTQLSVGHPVDRPVDRWKGRSTARSTDSRVRVISADSEICCI